MRKENQNGKVANSFMCRLVEFILNTKYECLPEDMIKLAKLSLIDTLGVSLAGWREPAVEIAKQVYAEGKGENHLSSLWGESVNVKCENAAIINGTASHVLDFDDAFVGVVIHPSAPILSALIPIAEELGSSGKDVITAYSIGTEVMIRIGQVMGIRHYSLGWHATNTLGTIGAAAACSYLLKLDKEQCANAIAISTSMAGGLQKNFGSMTKPLHVGMSASHAIQATRLAKNGFTGNDEIFGARGFFHAFSGGINEEEVNENLNSIRFGQPYELLESGIAVKKFPCCYGTHRFIQGVLDLKKEHQFKLDDIQEIILFAQQRSLLPLVHSRPVSGLQAKFSAEYTVLTAIADDCVRLSSFENEQVLRSEIQHLLLSVKVRAKKETSETKERLPVDIIIKTNDGQVWEKSVQHAPGSREHPLTEQEYLEKLIDCLNHYVKTNEVKLTTEIEYVAEELYHQGMKVEKYEIFSDWLSLIYKLFKPIK